MANQGRGNSGGLPQRSSDQDPPLSNDIIQQFLVNQAQSAQNEAYELRLQEKELELNAKQAQLMLEAQKQYLMSKPSENRKTMTRAAWILGGFMTLSLGFVIFCLLNGFEKFVFDLIKLLGYGVTTALGYYFGRKSKSNDGEDSSIKDIHTDD